MTTQNDVLKTVCAITGTPVPNYDANTHTHYGVISFNSLTGESLDDIYSCGDDLTYRAVVEEVKASIRGAIGDYVSSRRLDVIVDDMWDVMSDAFNDFCEGNMGESVYRLERAGYILETCPSLSAVYVLQSPYYTYTRACSPCCPNAGDLDSPVDIPLEPTSGTAQGLKTYALGPDWFDSDSPCPYPVFRMADGGVVSTGEIQS